MERLLTRVSCCLNAWQVAEVAKQLVARLLLSQIHANATIINSNRTIRAPGAPAGTAGTPQPAAVPAGLLTPPTRASANGATPAPVATPASTMLLTGPLVLTFADDSQEAAKSVAQAARQVHFKVSSALSTLQATLQGSPLLQGPASTIATDCAAMLNQQQLLLEGLLAAPELLAQVPALMAPPAALAPRLAGPPLPLPGIKGRSLSRQLSREGAAMTAAASPAMASATAAVSQPAAGSPSAMPTPFAAQATTGPSSLTAESLFAASPGAQAAGPPYGAPLPPADALLAAKPSQQQVAADLQRADTDAGMEERGVLRLYSFNRRMQQADDVESDAASVASASTLGVLHDGVNLPSMRRR